MLVLLTRVLLWASVGYLLWYVLTKIIPRPYLAWFGGFVLIVLIVLSVVDSDSSTVRAIWQILSFPLTPIGASVILLGGALTQGTAKVRGTPVAIALTILIVCSIPLLAQLLVGDAEKSVIQAYQDQAELCGDVCPAGTIPTQGNLGRAAAIVVVGDRDDIELPEAAPDVATNTTLAPRLIYAASLFNQAFNQGANPTVIVTAGNDRENSRQNGVIRDILTRNGVPSGNIRTPDTGLDIRGTALEVEDVLENSRAIAPRDVRRDQGTQNDPRVVVVAPAIVMSRTALTFERMNLEVIAKPTDFYTPGYRSNDLLEQLPGLLPSADALQLTSRYWNELLTSLYYFLRGWLPNFNFGWNSNIEI